MVSTPGDGIDLDCAVAVALRNGEPNFRLHFEYDWNPDPPLLQIVAIQGRVDLARVLLEAGATITADEFTEAFYWWSSAELVHCFLEFNTPYKVSLLHTALGRGKWDVVDILLDRGADINGVYQATYLLHTATWLGEQGFLESLLRRGADVHLRYPGGRTALMDACDISRSRRKAPPRIVETLLQHGSDPNTVTSKDESSLLLCVVEKRPNLPERTEIARLLLHYGADSNWAMPQGTTALMFAARDNDVPLATVLLDANASPYLKRQDGRDARDIAIQHDADDVVRLFDHRGYKS